MERVILFEDVKQFFLEYPDEFTDSSVIFQDGLDDDYDADPGYWVGEANDSVLADIQKFPGIKINSDSIEVDSVSVFTGKWMDHVDSITSKIAQAYDAYDDPDNTVWEDYGLGGDDDVDYNGGYLDMFAGLITQYVMCQEYNWKELTGLREV